MAQGGGDAGDLKPAGRGGGGVLERLCQPAGTPEAAVGDLDSPGVPDGTEHRLLIIPADPTQLDVVEPAERAGSGTSTATTRLAPLVRP